MTRLRIGVIGCGAIAQIQHLPHLRELSDLFEIGGLCDLSPQLLAVLGQEYGVPPERQYTDYRALVRSDLDAVLICTPGSHAPPAIAAAQAGKHILVEKPMCFTVREAEAMVEAADRAGVVLMVAYMKRYDPAYLYARERIRTMQDIRYVRVDHLHPDNALHLREFKIHRFDDVPATAREQITVETRRLVAEALGLPDVPPAVQRAFLSVLGSLIHDIGNLHGLFGPPQRVLHTTLWAEGRGIHTVLEYTGGLPAVCSWVDLPDLWEFTETLGVYGARERVIVSFPTGFSRGLPSVVTLHGMEANGHPWRKELAWHENPFKRELLHFHACVVERRPPETPGQAAISDVALVREIICAALR